MVRNEDIGRIEGDLGRALTEEERVAALTPEEWLFEIRREVEEQSEDNATIDDNGRIIPKPGVNIVYNERLLSESLREQIIRFRTAHSYTK